MNAALEEGEEAALREGIEKHADGADQRRSVHPFELLNAEARVRSKLSRVDQASEAFADRLALMLTRTRKRTTKIAGDLATMIGATERDTRLMQDGVVCVLESQASNGATGSALLHLGAPLLFEIVDRRFGGKGDTTRVATREPSALDLTVAAELAAVMLAELNEVRGELWPILKYQGALTKRGQAAALMGRQAMLVLAWREQGSPPEAPAALTLFLPGDAVDGRDHERNPPPSEEWRREFSERVSEANVELVVELGAVTLSLEELLGLAPGQLLRLDHSAHDELDVRVFGERVFSATPSAEGAHLVLTFDRWSKR